MTKRGPEDALSIGFLTVTNDSEQALYGGFLVLNHVGRPLEFHCTAPVRPSRAQQILYGPTLTPFLHGERVAPALINAARSAPTIVITDCGPALIARPLVNCPLVLLGSADPRNSAPNVRPIDRQATYRLDAAHAADQPRWLRTTHAAVGPHRILMSAEHADDGQVMARVWDVCKDCLDLTEPFQRIREAIDEARATT